jgi:DNA repair exonuclease SbcCD ATPase subunit
MITGRDTLQEINSHALQAQSLIEGADGEADSLTQRLSRLRLEEAEQYRKLAEFRLDDIRAGAVTVRLDKAYEAVDSYMEQHQQDIAALDTDLAKLQQQQQVLDQQRESKRKERDQAADDLQQQVQISKTNLENSTDYLHQQEKALQATEVARRADEKASQAEADLDRKGKPYQDDKLFMYLWNRRYLTPDYAHGGIIRKLDDGVARLIGFKKARADYHMLTELPRRLRAHATQAAEEAERERQSIQEMEQQAAEKDGLPTLQATLDTAEDQLQQINADIESTEKQYQELLRQRKDLTVGDDNNTLKALSLIAAELEREDIISLFQQAQSTPRPEDDAIVKQLHKLQQESNEISKRLTELKTIQEKQRHALEELARVRGKFRRRNYDARHSSFPSGLGLGVLLGELLRGGRSSGSAWDRIEHAQKWNPPKGGGGFGGGFGGFGGGFGSGGGGGFRTGGGF